MFLDELSPFVKEFVGHPAAFLGGFVSGLLRLNLADDPVKPWLDKQAKTAGTSSSMDNGHSKNGNGSGPTTITID